ncbi:hypothetical protein DV515_00019684, partial [Chloebia gouldiae]
RANPARGFAECANPARGFAESARLRKVPPVQIPSRICSECAKPCTGVWVSVQGSGRVHECATRFGWVCKAFKGCLVSVQGACKAPEVCKGGDECARVQKCARSVQWVCKGYPRLQKIPWVCNEWARGGSDECARSVRGSGSVQGGFDECAGCARGVQGVCKVCKGPECSMGVQWVCKGSLMGVQGVCKERARLWKCARGCARAPEGSMGVHGGSDECARGVQGVCNEWARVVDECAMSSGRFCVRPMMCKGRARLRKCARWGARVLNCAMGVQWVCNGCARGVQGACKGRARATHHRVSSRGRLGRHERR